MTTDQRRSGVEALQRDAAALFSFVDSICEHCYGGQESPAYLKPSLEFFEYIRKLGDSTKAYLNIFPEKAPRHERLHQVYRAKLEDIRYGWFDLHPYIKAAVEADTLNAPYTLIEALTARLNDIAGFERTRFAIFHFDELNYLEVPIGEIKKITEKFARVIPDPPQFPPNLGLIGIPYSQSSSLYLNCMISHEIGHFVFENKGLKDQLLPTLDAALSDPKLSRAPNEPAERLKDILASWAEELFCDLFAVWLTGPCYSFTYVELIGLTTVLDPAALNGFSITEGSKIFSASHPADLLRVREQALLLGRLHWWEEVESIKSHYTDVLRAAAGVDKSDLEFPHCRTDLVQAFFTTIPRIRDLVVDVMKDSNQKELDAGLTGYKRFGKLVQQYLREAVVPSTVYDGKDHWYPDTITLLNASMRFYLESIEELMNGIKDQKTFLAGHRSRWIKRLEALTGKAIEDYHWLVSENRSVPSDGAFKRADRRALESADN